MKGWLITGTDTEIGKTHTTIALMKRLQQQGHKVVGMKPIASGCQTIDAGVTNADALAIQAAGSNLMPYEMINPYALKPPIAPHLAAQHDGVQIDIAELVCVAHRLACDHDMILVEGVGGWMVPLSDQHMLSDLAEALALPVIVVVGMRLGCINHALLTVAAIKASRLPLAGWIANSLDPHMDEQEAVLDSLTHLIDEPLLGRMPYHGALQLVDHALLMQG